MKIYNWGDLIQFINYNRIDHNLPLWFIDIDDESEHGIEILKDEKRGWGITNYPNMGDRPIIKILTEEASSSLDLLPKKEENE